jgi:hypothetical protein
MCLHITDEAGENASAMNGPRDGRGRERSLFRFFAEMTLTGMDFGIHHYPRSTAAKIKTDTELGIVMQYS